MALVLIAVVAGVPLLVPLAGAGVPLLAAGVAWRLLWSASGGASVSVDALLSQMRPGKKLSILDPRTALLQRWYFELRIAEEAERCRRYGLTMAVLFVRPQFGEGRSGNWAEGPEAESAQMFIHTLRAADMASMINFNLFAVCLMHTDEWQARSVARRLLGHNHNGASESPAADVRLAVCPAGGANVEALLASALAVDLDGLPSEATPADRPALRLAPDLASLITSQASGKIAPEATETMAQAKARVRKAARRAGVSVKLWEAGGVVYFENTQTTGAGSREQVA